MSIQPKISIIVPVYKVEPYLHQCIDSILAQTCTNLEVILIDDGSPDDCGAICDKYAKIDNRIIVIHKKNSGVSDARNVGIEIATGEYVSFVDSDDWIDPDMIETLYNNLINNDADISCCEHYISYLNSNKKLKYSNEALVFDREQAVKQLILNKYISNTVWGKLYKKSLFNEIRFPENISYYEDFLVIMDVLSATNYVVDFDAPKYYYRMRKGSLVHISYSSKKMEIIKSTEKILKIIENKYSYIIDIGNARLLKANFDVLSTMVFNTDYIIIPEYKKILSTLRKNFKFMMQSKVFTRNEKIKLIAVKLNIRLYKALMTINNWKKRRLFFE